VDCGAKKLNQRRSMSVLMPQDRSPFQVSPFTFRDLSSNIIGFTNKDYNSGMPNKYLDSINIASENYGKQEERPGYKRGWLSWLRHFNAKNNPVVKKLKDSVEACEQDSQAKEIIEAHFKENQFNNHSFSIYLLDELLKNFPTENWAQYQPKPVVFFQGTVFRGTQIPPEIVFKHGFSDRNPSKNLDNYISDFNGSVGVSTTKELAIAKSYALPRLRKSDMDYSDAEPYGYIYKITCRSNTAIDLEATHIKRNNLLGAKLSKGKAEVNIVGNIKACDVMMAWKVYRDSRPAEILLNEHKYEGNNEREKDTSYPEIIVPHRDIAQANPAEEKQQSEVIKKPKM
jgi:hypothetical protein